MTKVIILGQEPKKEKKLKPIEFTDFLEITKEIKQTETNPRCWDNIELIGKYDSFDIMFAYDNDRNKGCLFLGYFNDGVIE